MGWTDRFRRKPALESRAEWGSSAIPLPNEGNANTYANVDLRRADSSLQKVAVWAAVTLLARLVSSLPLDTYRRRGDGPPANIGNSRFLDDPTGDGQGLPDWLSQYMMSVLLRGNVYGKQILGPDAYPTQIVLYHPDTVDGWRDPYTGQVHWYVEGKDLGASGVWHRRAYPMPGNLLGMSPIGLHMTTIGQGMAAARFGYQFFADGAMPTGMLRNTEVAIDKRVADIAKARWMAAMHGSREVAVMGKGWEYQAIQVAPEESQFLETQKYTAAECARIYGPGVPEILGYETGGSMTYANVDQRSLHLLIYSLDPWLTGLERMFTAMLPQPQFVKFNRAALLRMTTDQRYAAYQTASLIGLQTPNEQRAMEDWGPVPWGDKPWVPAQQAPPPGPTSARSQISVRTEDPWDEESAALLVALAQLDDEEGFAQRAWDAGKHPRIPKGEPGGGRFLSLVEQFKTAIKKHAEGGGGGHPLDGFNREQLRRVAKARGIELKRGEDRDSIAKKLLDHLGVHKAGNSPDAEPNGGVDLDNPDLGTDPLSKDILEGLTKHGDSADDHVNMLVEDGMDRDIARLYVNEIVDLHNSRHPESPLQHASEPKPKAAAEPPAKTHLGGNVAKPERKPPTSKPSTKQSALDAAPVKLGKYGFDRGIEGDVAHRVDVDALNFYAGHGYIEINSYLRDGRSYSGEGKAEWSVKEIDSVMDRSALTSDVYVHRGVGDLGMFGADARNKKSLVGMEYVDKAYASVTADPNVAKEFFGAEDYGGHGAILNITVPAGIKAIQLSDLGPKPRYHWEFPRPPEDEAEILLQRGLTFRVVRDRIVGGTRQLDVEVVPK